MTNAPRHRMRKHKRRQIDWQVLYKLVQGGHSCQAVAALYTDVHLRTLQRRYKQWLAAQQAGDAHAVRVAVGEIDGRTYNRSALGRDGDQQLAAEVRGTILAGQPVDRTFVSGKASAIFSSRNVYNTRSTFKFVMTSQFHAGFHRRHGFTHRKPHCKQVTVAVQRDEDAAIDASIEYMEAVHAAVEKYGKHYVMNADETPAKPVQEPTKVLCLQDVITSVPTKVSTRKTITIMPTIAADGSVLPLQVIVRGGTQIAVNNKHLPSTVHAYPTNNGWQNEWSMKRHIEDIVSPYTRNHPSTLIIDSYAAHLTDDVRETAARHKIDLIVVPKGGTAVLQPLDVSINGIIKQKARAQWASDKIMLGEAADTFKRAVERIEAALRSIKPATIAHAFVKAIPLLA
jgi:hypothetical protein